MQLLLVVVLLGHLIFIEIPPVSESLTFPFLNHWQRERLDFVSRVENGHVKVWSTHGTRKSSLSWFHNSFVKAKSAKIKVDKAKFAKAQPAKEPGAKVECPKSELLIQ